MRTVDGKVAEGSAGGALNLTVVTSQEVKDGVQSVAANLADFLLCDFGKGQGRRALEIDIVREGESSQGCQRGSSEEVCGAAVCWIETQARRCQPGRECGWQSGD